MLGYSWGIGSDEVLTIGVPELTGNVVMDGSLMNAPFKQLRAGGWAALCKVSGEIRAVYGAVPMPRPTSLSAELWAVLQALRHSGVGLSELVTDCATVVKGLKKGRVWCTASGRPQAHVWLSIWSKLEDMQLVPGQNLMVTKVKAHKKAGDKKKLDQLANQPLVVPGAAQARLELLHTVLNEKADALAKKGAAHSGPPSWKVEEAKAKLNDAKMVLEFVARFRVELDDLKTTDYQPVRGKGKGTAAARALETQRRQEQQQQRRKERGREHDLECLGSTAICRRCNKRAFTALGKAKLESTLCTPTAQGLSKRQSVPPPPEPAASAVELMQAEEQAGHHLESLGPLTFCLKCG